MGHCVKCNKELPDSPPNLELCVECLTDILLSKIKKYPLYEVREYDEG